jgi:predicted secreted protein
MRLATVISGYIVVWWIVLFTVLPWGAKPSEHPGVGHATSAPENPRLVLKAIVTTIIAAIVWGAFLAAIEYGLINFD